MGAFFPDYLAEVTCSRKKSLRLEFLSCDAKVLVCKFLNSRLPWAKLQTSSKSKQLTQQYSFQNLLSLEWKINSQSNRRCRVLLRVKKSLSPINPRDQLSHQIGFPCQPPCPPPYGPPCQPPQCHIGRFMRAQRRWQNGTPKVQSARDACASKNL